MRGFLLGVMVGVGGTCVVGSLILLHDLYNMGRIISGEQPRPFHEPPNRRYRGYL
jgi:hypothetical protein